MRVISDSEQWVNLHPFVVYFVLSKSTHDLYADKLKRLARYKAYNRGIFKFHIVRGDHESSLGVVLRSTCNVMVRLLSDAKDDYRYLIDKIDFYEEPAKVAERIRRFIDTLCQYDMAHLDLLLKQPVVTPNDALVRDSILSIYNHFNQTLPMQQNPTTFWSDMTSARPSASRSSKSAAKVFNHSTSGSLVNSLPDHGMLMAAETIDFFDHDICMAAEDSIIPASAKEQLRTYGVPEDNMDALWEFVMKYTGAPDKKTSDTLAEGFSHPKHNREVLGEHAERVAPTTSQDITIELKSKYKELKSQKRGKPQWVVEIHANGDSFSIHFPSNPALFIYVCALIRRKLGLNTYRHEFVNNSRGMHSPIRRKDTIGWLKELYAALFNGKVERLYNMLNTGLNDNDTSILNNAKSHANGFIKESLLDSQSDAIYDCSLHLKYDDLGDSYYDLPLDPSRIILPTKLQRFADDFYEMTHLPKSLSTQSGTPRE